MKLIPTITLAVAVAALAVPASSFAASSFAAKGSKEGKGAAKMLRSYDTNSNGVIDGAEIEALRKAFEADKTGALKEFDKDADGKLSDEEISAIKIKAKKAK